MTGDHALKLPDQFAERFERAVIRLVDHPALLMLPRHIVIAVSGGIDSLALLLAWHSFAYRLNHQLIVAHFDHQLRPDSADAASALLTMTRQLGLPLIVGQPDTPILESKRGSMEAAARRARYAFLLATAKKHSAPFIATAHQQDDQVETILFQLCRGTSIAGIAGMSASRKLDQNCRLIRPLLGFTRAELAAIVEQSGWKHIEDGSNQATEIRRNWVRQHLLPELKSHINPKVDEALLRLAQQARQHAKLLDRQARKLLRKLIVPNDQKETGNEKAPDRPSSPSDQPERDEPVLLCRAVARHCSDLLLGRCLHAIWRRQGWPRRAISAHHYSMLINLLRAGQPRIMQFPGGIVARVRSVKKQRVLELRRV